MKNIKKIGLLLLSIILCFSTVACTLTDEDIETIASVVSIINEYDNESSYSGDNYYDEETVTTSSAESDQQETVGSNSFSSSSAAQETVDYYFRSDKLLTQHYEKHGIEMGFASKEEYQAAASAVVNNPNALHKKEAEDNDDIYYIEETNEFVVVSTDGYIRTYFNPSAGIDYYNRQ